MMGNNYGGEWENLTHGMMACFPGTVGTGTNEVVGGRRKEGWRGWIVVFTHVVRCVCARRIRCVGLDRLGFRTHQTAARGLAEVRCDGMVVPRVDRKDY